MGLGYLTLDRLHRPSRAARASCINLSTSLGSGNLTGSLYILDEPSIGLHPRDTNRLIKVLQQLRDLGNTVIVVEHEEEVIRAAGLDRGHRSQKPATTAAKWFSAARCAAAKRKSLTADYLTGRREIVFRQPPADGATR